MYKIVKQLYQEMRNTVRVLETEIVVYENRPVFCENEQVTT